MQYSTYCSIFGRVLFSALIYSLPSPVLPNPAPELYLCLYIGRVEWYWSSKWTLILKLRFRTTAHSLGKNLFQLCSLPDLISRQLWCQSFKCFYVKGRIVQIFFKNYSLLRPLRFKKRACATHTRCQTWWFFGIDLLRIYLIDSFVLVLWYSRKSSVCLHPFLHYLFV